MFEGGGGEERHIAYFGDFNGDSYFGRGVGGGEEDELGLILRVEDSAQLGEGFIIFADRDIDEGGAACERLLADSHNGRGDLDRLNACVIVEGLIVDSGDDIARGTSLGDDDVNVVIVTDTRDGAGAVTV